MLRNYFLVTLRNMVRNKLFTLINILGISVSLACCILLFSYATRELGYDRQNENVYRLTTEISQKDGQVFKLGSSSPPIAPSMQQEIPEVVLAIRAANTDFFGYENLIKYENNSWYIRDAYFVDSSFFGVLKYKIIRGSAERPFANNSSAVIEKEWADKIFGQADPIGKMVRVVTAFGPADLEISAVYDKNGYSSHLTPSMMVPMSNPVCNSFFNKEQTNWIGNNMVFSYARLSPGSDPKVAERKLNNLIKVRGGDEMKLIGVNKIMKFQPASSIHTDNEVYMANIPGVVSSTVIKVLILIGIMILALACVNYINLSTAQAGNRALEVGVRKVMGVTPGGLVVQFLGESFLLVFISLLVSVIIARLTLPAFNQLIDKPLSFTPAFYKTLAGFLGLFLLVTGLAAGIYPAIYLASFRPAMVLKGRSRDRIGTSFLRKGLVVFQFIISIALISSILVITNQVKFIKNKELGFNKNSKLVITMGTDDAIKQYETLKEKFGTNAFVHSISGADATPGSFIAQDILLYKKGQTMNDAIHIYNNRVDLNYFDVMGMKLISGRYFKDYTRDTVRTQILISEEAARKLGFKPEEAPGEIVYFDWTSGRFAYEIIGVVNDIHQESLHKAIDPMMYTLSDNKQYRNIIIDADMSHFQSMISRLESQWKELVPDAPLTYYTLDDHLMVQYAKDFNTFDLIKYFALISVVISCLGLYAMSLFLAERRFREIGIRKAFGAGVRNIVVMVSADLTWLILIAFALSIPVSIWAMNKWLATFAYKIHQGVAVYIWAGIISLSIGWVTISYQSFRAARTNPVKVLREE